MHIHLDRSLVGLRTCPRERDRLYKGYLLHVHGDAVWTQVKFPLFMRYRV